MKGILHALLLVVVAATAVLLPGADAQGMYLNYIPVVSSVHVSFRMVRGVTSFVTT